MIDSIVVRHGCIAMATRPVLIDFSPEHILFEGGVRLCIGIEINGDPKQVGRHPFPIICYSRSGTHSPVFASFDPRHARLCRPQELDMGSSPFPPDSV